MKETSQRRRHRRCRHLNLLSSLASRSSAASRPSSPRPSSEQSVSSPRCLAGASSGGERRRCWRGPSSSPSPSAARRWQGGWKSTPFWNRAARAPARDICFFIFFFDRLRCRVLRSEGSREGTRKRALLPLPLQPRPLFSSSISPGRRRRRGPLGARPRRSPTRSSSGLLPRAASVRRGCEPGQGRLRRRRRSALCFGFFGFFLFIVFFFFERPPPLWPPAAKDAARGPKAGLRALFSRRPQTLATARLPGDSATLVPLLQANGVEFAAAGEDPGVCRGARARPVPDAVAPPRAAAAPDVKGSQRARGWRRALELGGSGSRGRGAGVMRGEGEMAAGWEEGRNGELLIFCFLFPPGERDSFEDRARRAY